MKGFKELRLVYRQHLLPPVVLPFENAREYRKLLDDESYGLRRKELSNSDEREISEINEAVVTQLFKFKDCFIVPLRKCPFYFEQLDKKVRDGLIKGRHVPKNYGEVIRELSILDRARVHNRFLLKYKQFVREVSGKNSDLFKKITYIPIFIYQSAQEIAEFNKKQWQSLSQFDKIQWQFIFQKRIKQHWQKLKLISQQSTVPFQQFIQLVKYQIQPDLPEGLKTLLQI